MIGPGIVFSLLIAAFTLTIYYIIRSKHLENMARIEHGIAEAEQISNFKPLLNLGLFLSFLGIGFLIAYLVTQNSNVPEYIALPTCLLISGGIGLILSYIINSRITK